MSVFLAICVPTARLVLCVLGRAPVEEKPAPRLEVMGRACAQWTHIDDVGRGVGLVVAAGCCMGRAAEGRTCKQTACWVNAKFCG